MNSWLKLALYAFIGVIVGGFALGVLGQNDSMANVGYLGNMNQTMPNMQNMPGMQNTPNMQNMPGMQNMPNTGYAGPQWGFGGIGERMRNWMRFGFTGMPNGMNMDPSQMNGMNMGQGLMNGMNMGQNQMQMNSPAMQSGMGMGMGMGMHM